jgi:hypothetical protein
MQCFQLPRFFVRLMRVAPTAELLVSNAVLVLLFVLGRRVVATFALLAGQSDDVTHV